MLNIPNMTTRSFLRNSFNGFEEEFVYVPLRCRILSLFSEIPCFTVGSASKLLKKDRKRVIEVLNSMKRTGLVDCYVDNSKMRSGYRPMTHYWIITDLGKRILYEGPDDYN